MIKTRSYTLEGRDREGRKVKLRATQGPQTFNETKALITLFGGISLKEVANKGVSGVLEYLDEHHLFEDFFDLILHAERKPSEVLDLGTVESGLLSEILADFFLLNRKLTRRLIDFFQDQRLQTGIAIYLTSLIRSLAEPPGLYPDPNSSTK